MKKKMELFIKIGNYIWFVPMVMGFSMVALDLFVATVPNMVFILIALFQVMTVACVVWTNKTKKALVVGICAAAMVFLTILYAGTAMNPYFHSVSFRNVNYYQADSDKVISYKVAQKDLDLAVKYLKKLHPANRKGLSESEKQAYEEALRFLQAEEEITVNELAIAIESVFSVLHDGHTFALAAERDPHYLKTIHEHNEAGNKVVAVNGLSPEELFAENTARFSFETERFGLSGLKDRLSTIENLNYIGIDVSEGVEFTYERINGELFSVMYYPEDFLTYDEYMTYNGLWSQTADSAQNAAFVSYEILPQYNLAVLTLSSCRYNETYRSCVKEFFEKVNSYGIRDVCVDLRGNGGGNSLVADEFIGYLDVDSYEQIGGSLRLGAFSFGFGNGTLKNSRKTETPYTGNVYVLTDINSFSSAMDFAQLIGDNDLGTVIGEACGNVPNHYGEIVCFMLPGSDIFLQISTKQFYRVDRNNSDIELTPDVLCDGKDALKVLCGMLNRDGKENCISIRTDRYTGKGIVYRESAQGTLYLAAPAHLFEGMSVGDTFSVTGCDGLVTTAKLAYLSEYADVAFAELENTGDAVMKPVLNDDSMLITPDDDTAGYLLYEKDGKILSYTANIKYGWIYVEDFGMHMTVADGSAEAGLSGCGLYGASGNFAGLLCGSSEEISVFVPAAVIESEWQQAILK